MLDVTLLMAVSSLGKERKQRVPDLRFGERAIDDSEVENRQMATVEMPDQSDALSCNDSLALNMPERNGHAEFQQRARQA